MSYEEQQLKGEYAAAAEQMTVPPELDQRIRASYHQFLKEKKERVPMNKKKWLAAAVVAGLLLVPSGTFAYGYMTDDLYGSFDNFKQMAKYATQSTYTQFGMKLSGAKKELGAEDYDKFMRHLKEFVAFKVKYGEGWHVDNDKLTPAQYAEAKQLRKNLQPYFDRLNHEKLSTDVFTAEEYDRWLDADMTYDTIYAQTGISDRDPVDVDKLPENLKARYLEAEKITYELNKKKQLPRELTPYEQQIKNGLTAEEFQRYQQIQERKRDLEYDYAKQGRGLNYDRVPADVRAELKQLIGEEFALRDKGQKGKALRDILTPTQYDEYVEASMTLITVAAQSGQQGNFRPGDLPNDLRDRYEAADATMSKYNNMR
jgi:hypothetical protein